MYKEIVKILQCPKCKGQLTLSIAKEENGEVIEGDFKCQCGEHYLYSM